MNKQFAWSMISYGFPRAVIALKFLYAARLGGAGQMGLVGETLLVISIAEALTEFGLNQAVIQSAKSLTQRSIGALWMLSAFRGSAVFLILASVGFSMARWNGNQVGSLMPIAALASLFRCCSSPAIWHASRSLLFRRLAGLSVAQVLVDISAFLVMESRFSIALAFITASVLGELVKTLLSFGLRDSRMHVGRPDFSGVSEELAYARQIWLVSLSATVLNQTDKFVTALVAGPTGLGAYQTTARLAQFILAEPCLAIQTYLFPRFAELNREAEIQTRSSAAELVAWVVRGLIYAAFALAINAEFFLKITLGDSWIQFAKLFQIFAIAMMFAGLNAVAVALAKGRGDPRSIKVASWIQAAAYALFLIPVWFTRSLLGLAAAYCASVAIGTSAILCAQRKTPIVDFVSVGRTAVAAFAYWIPCALIAHMLASQPFITVCFTVTWGCLGLLLYLKGYVK